MKLTKNQLVEWAIKNIGATQNMNDDYQRIANECKRRGCTWFAVTHLTRVVDSSNGVLVYSFHKNYRSAKKSASATVFRARRNGNGTVTYNKES